MAERRIPREQVEAAADLLAERFGLDPEHVMCDFLHGTVEVKAELLLELLQPTA